MTRPACLGGTPAFPRKVPMVRPALPAFEDLCSEFREILASGMVTKGAYLRRFEEAMAAHLGVDHAVGVSSCTTGLMLTYRGLGLEGEILVPSFTFMATVSAAVWAGLKPCFVDARPDTANLDPEAVQAAITPRTCAIVAVHNFGNPADIEALEGIAARRGLKLIFDAAHALGSLRAGRPVGAQGDAQVYSLSPTKLVICGEGGLVATNDARLAAKIRIGREYGNDGSYDSAFAGFNARLPELSAVLGIKSLAQLAGEVERRNHLATLYRDGLAGIPGLRFQWIRPGDRSSYKDLTVFIEGAQLGLSRHEVAAALLQENIDSRKYYDPPVHRQTAYLPYWDGKALPVTDELATSALSLPLWSRLDDSDVRSICAAIHRIVDACSAVRKVLTV